MDVLHVDCHSCVARGTACSDCVVTVLLGTSDGVVEFDSDEQAALRALAGSGLVPPLRLIPGARQVRDHDGRSERRDATPRSRAPRRSPPPPSARPVQTAA